MTDTPTLWKHMTDAEKGACLLAEYRGQPVQAFVGDKMNHKFWNFVFGMWVGIWLVVFVKIMFA